MSNKKLFCSECIAGDIHGVEAKYKVSGVCWDSRGVRKMPFRKDVSLDKLTGDAQ